MTETQEARDQAANAITVRPFRLLWINNIAFFLVSNAQRFAFGWIVLDLLLRDETQQGLVVFTLGLPVAVLVLHAGVWADRWDRKRMLIGTQLAAAVVMMATALLIRSGGLNIGWIIAATLCAGAATAVGHPVRSSLVPQLVAREQLFSAIALNAIAMTLSLILGPVLVKVVGDQFGFDGAFWFQAGLLLAGTLVLLRLEIPPHEEVRDPAPVLAEARVAIRHILDDPQLRTLFGLLLLSSVTINPAVMVTLQAHVKEELGRTAGDAAIPFAMMGIGMALSSVFLMRKGDMKNKGAAFQRAMMCGCTVTFLIGMTNSFVVATTLAGFMGLAGGFFINMNQGLIQANTPQALMGRVMGIYTLVAQGLFPVGALVVSVIASQIGTGVAMSSVAAAAFVVVLVTYVRNAELRQLG